MSDRCRTNTNIGRSSATVIRTSAGATGCTGRSKPIACRAVWSGASSRDGAVPRRLYPIFRDNEELPTSADLGGNINEALRQSRYLIVICSPRSAVSRWVNQEITTFKALGREQRILCLIVDGEPNASDNPDFGLLECFPRAIRYHFDQNGQQTSERVEPIAADGRDGKLSRADARLKLVAGLLGVGFDELKRREKRRIFWRRMQYAAAAVVLLAALGVVWLNFFVKQVRTEYFEAGQRELLSNRPDRAAPYLAEAKRLGSDNPALPFLLRQALRPYELQWTNLVGHKGNVIGVRYDATGSRLVTTATDLTARIWDKTGKQLVLLKGHTETIGDAAFSADGAMVVTASIDKSAIVWDASNGARVATLSGHDVGVSSAVFDPAGTRVLTVSGDKARLSRCEDRAPSAYVSTPVLIRRSAQSAGIQPGRPACRAGRSGFGGKSLGCRNRRADIDAGGRGRPEHSAL